MDVDRNALLEFEKRLGLKSKWVDVDSEQLPFDDNHFDTVVFSEVMGASSFSIKSSLRDCQSTDKKWYIDWIGA